MRLFVLAIILAVSVSLGATTPAFSQDANPELTEELETWLVGSWLCQYSPSMKATAIYREDNQFVWIFRIGMPPYVTVVRQMGSYQVMSVPGGRRPSGRCPGNC